MRAHGRCAARSISVSTRATMIANPKRRRRRASGASPHTSDVVANHLCSGGNVPQRGSAAPGLLTVVVTPGQLPSAKANHTCYKRSRRAGMPARSVTPAPPWRRCSSAPSMAVPEADLAHEISVWSERPPSGVEPTAIEEVTAIELIPLEKYSASGRRGRLRRR